MMIPTTNHDDDPFDAIFEGFVTVIEPVLADMRVFACKHRCPVGEQQNRRCHFCGSHISVPVFWRPALDHKLKSVSVFVHSR